MKSILYLVLFSFVCVVVKCDQKTENRLSSLEKSIQVLGESVNILTKKVDQILQHGERTPSTKQDGQRNQLQEQKKEGEIIGTGNKMNDTDLEQRVGILEFQMSNVIDDVTDVETQVTLIEADVTFIQADQTTQDQRILELETDAEDVAAAIFGLDNDVFGLKSADNNLNSSILQLDTKIIELEAANVSVQSKIVNLETMDAEFDDRLSRLELDGAVAFNAALGVYESIPEGSVVAFPDVILNLGNGYDGATGEFTVPPGGAGLYFFYTHALIIHAEVGIFDIMLNGAKICRLKGGEQPGMPDWSTSSCGATVLLAEGDIVYVVYNAGTDDTPVSSGDANKQNTFSGFRIAPEN